MTFTSLHFSMKVVRNPRILALIPRLLPRQLLPRQETREMRVQSLGWEDPLEEGMATDSSIVALKTPWTEEPGRLQSIGL